MPIAVMTGREWWAGWPDQPAETLPSLDTIPEEWLPQGLKLPTEWLAFLRRGQRELVTVSDPVPGDDLLASPGLPTTYRERAADRAGSDDSDLIGVAIAGQGNVRFARTMPAAQTRALIAGAPNDFRAAEQVALDRYLARDVELPLARAIRARVRAGRTRHDSVSGRSLISPDGTTFR